MGHDIFLPKDFRNILASESKFGQAVDSERLEKIIYTVYASHTGTVYIDVKNDNDQSTAWRAENSYGYSATTLNTYEVIPSTKWVRIRVVNDATNTTTHELTTRLVPKKIAVIEKVKRYG